MRDCEQARRALLDAVDGELTWLERLRLRLHLLLCPPCRREEASLDRTLRLLHRCRGGCGGEVTQRVREEGEEK